MNYITNDNLEVADKEVFEIVEAELARQTNHLEMIASENFTSPAVMQAMGSDRKSTRLNSSHSDRSRMPSSA